LPRPVLELAPPDWSEYLRLFLPPGHKMAEHVYAAVGFHDLGRTLEYALWSTRHQAETCADAIDRRLHAERLQPDGRRQRRHLIRARELSDGAINPSAQCMVAADP
jgi:hypothetical protein